MEDDYGPDFQIAEFRHSATFSGEPAIIVDSRVRSPHKFYPASFVDAVRDKESEFSKWCREWGISKSYPAYKAWCREIGVLIND